MMLAHRIRMALVIARADRRAERARTRAATRPTKAHAAMLDACQAVDADVEQIGAITEASVDKVRAALAIARSAA